MVWLPHAIRCPKTIIGCKLHHVTTTHGPGTIIGCLGVSGVSGVSGMSNVYDRVNKPEKNGVKVDVERLNQ